jgi:hypothetical protein
MRSGSDNSFHPKVANGRSTLLTNLFSPYNQANIIMWILFSGKKLQGKFTVSKGINHTAPMTQYCCQRFRAAFMGKTSPSLQGHSKFPASCRINWDLFGAEASTWLPLSGYGAANCKTITKVIQELSGFVSPVPSVLSWKPWCSMSWSNWEFNAPNW